MTTSTNPIDPLGEILSNLYNSAWVEGSNWKSNNPEHSPVPSEREVKKVAKAKAKLNQLILEKQISELKRTTRDVGAYPHDIQNYNNELLGKWSERKLTHSKIENRISELEQQLRSKHE